MFLLVTLLMLVSTSSPAPAGVPTEPLGGALPAAREPLAGDWLGELALGGERSLIRLSLRRTDGQWDGTLSAPTLGLDAQPLQNVALDEGQMRFSLAAGGETLAFAFRLEEGELRGSGGPAAAPGALRLIRLGSLESPERLAGIFESADGRRFWIGTFSELGADPYFLDFASGRFGPLFPLPDESLVSGSGLMLPFPIEVRVTPQLAASGEARAVGVKLGDGPVFTALHQSLRREAVRFQSGTLELAGTLTLPATAGRHAALVLVHGSGPLDRTWFALWADFFARQGLVTLAYDKRGTGASQGDWKAADFDALAADAQAGVDLLRRRSEVDPRRVGLWGISQGGWIGALVASRDPRLAFLVLHAGPATTVFEQGIDNLESELHAAGLKNADVAAALELMRLDLAYDLEPSDAAWARLTAARAAPATAALAWVPPLEPRDSWFRTYYGKILGFDPRPHLERTRCPVLAFFGGVDANVPAEKNRARIAAALDAAGNRDVTLVVLPHANHLFLSAETGARSEIPKLREIDPAYFSTLAAWLAARGFTSPEPLTAP